SRPIPWVANFFHSAGEPGMCAPPHARTDARAIWDAAVAAARPEVLIREAFTDPTLALTEVLAQAPRIIVVGCGKAGAAMSEAVENVLSDQRERVEGLVNVPNEAVRPLRRIRLQGTRPAGTNEPTPEGVEATRRILELAASAGPDDV